MIRARMVGVALAARRAQRRRPGDPAARFRFVDPDAHRPSPGEIRFEFRATALGLGTSTRSASLTDAIDRRDFRRPESEERWRAAVAGTATGALGRPAPVVGGR